jgi:hypothetical protein
MNMTADRCQRCNGIWASNSGPRENFSLVTRFCPECLATLPLMGAGIRVGAI